LKAKSQYLHGQIGFWVYGDDEISDVLGQKIASYFAQMAEAIKEEEGLGDTGSQWVLTSSPEDAARTFYEDYTDIGKEKEDGNSKTTNPQIIH